MSAEDGDQRPRSVKAKTARAKCQIAPLFNGLATSFGILNASSEFLHKATPSGRLAARQVELQGLQ